MPAGGSPSTSTPSSKRGVILGFMMVSLVCLASANEISAKIRSNVLKEYNAIISQIMGSVVLFIAYLTIFLVNRKRISDEEVQFLWSFWKIADERAPEGKSESESSPAKPEAKVSAVRAVLDWFGHLGPWKYAAIFSLFDILGSAFGSIAQPELSVTTFAVIRKSAVAIIFFWSLVLLKKRYVLWEVMGVGIVFTVTIVVSLSGCQGGGHDSVIFAMLLLLGRSIHGLGYVLMEKIFREYEAKYVSVVDGEEKKRKLDPFVTATMCSMFMLLWMVPILLLMEAVRISHSPDHPPLGRHFLNAFRCLANSPNEEMIALAQSNWDSKYSGNPEMILEFDPSDVCRDGWQSFLVYSVINVIFNIVLYIIVKMESALLVFVCMQLSLPLSSSLSLISWPHLPADSLRWIQILCIFFMLGGVALFRYGNQVNERRRKEHEEKVESGGAERGSYPWLCLFPLIHWRGEGRGKRVEGVEDPERGQREDLSFKGGRGREDAVSVSTGAPSVSSKSKKHEK